MMIQPAGIYIIIIGVALLLELLRRYLDGLRLAGFAGWRAQYFTQLGLLCNMLCRRFAGAFFLQMWQG